MGLPSGKGGDWTLRDGTVRLLGAGQWGTIIEWGSHREKGAIRPSGMGRLDPQGRDNGRWVGKAWDQGREV